MTNPSYNNQANNVTYDNVTNTYNYLYNTWLVLYCEDYGNPTEWYKDGTLIM